MRGREAETAKGSATIETPGLKAFITEGGGVLTISRQAIMVG